MKRVNRLFLSYLVLPLLLLTPPAAAFAAEAAPAGPTPQIIVHGYPPELLRIPGTISLLAETPFYNKPDDSLNGEPAGVLAPQEGVQVLLGERGWARGRSWWQISTTLGPKWISPEPWTVDTPPPEKITLFLDTPIYPGMDDTAPPTAVLSPQEVQVAGAEQQWFYANSSDELKWVRIHTSWLGDQWVHLPVARIGYLRPVDSYAYYNGPYLLNDPNYEGSYGSMAGPKFRWLMNETVRVTGEYVNVYDLAAYRVETRYGTKYVQSKGSPVVREQKEVVLRTDTPLLPRPVSWNGMALVLHPQTVTSFEHMEGSHMYHVRTSWGEAWVNPDFSEPADTVKVAYGMTLSGRHTLYQFPYEGFQTEFLTEGQTIRPSASWMDKQGTVWYRLDSENGRMWVMEKADSSGFDR